MNEVITTLEELQALPVGSVVRAVEGPTKPWFKHNRGWMLPGLGPTQFSSAIWPDERVAFALPLEVLAHGYQRS